MNTECVSDVPSLASSSRKKILNDLFSVDIRGLAALRIALSIIVLVDLMTSFSVIELFCSDEGVLTGRQAQEFLGGGYWSIFWLNGSVWFSQLLLAITGLAAIGLLLGFKTKWMNAVCLVMVWSLQIRNPLVLTAGDILIRLFLFWMMFLPTAKIWSVDSIGMPKGKKIRWSVCSVASAAILLQLAFVYFFSGIAKLNDFWFDGDALEYTLNLEMYVRPLGRWLLGVPMLLQLVTLVTLLAEIVGPIFLFVPKLNRFVRGLLMALFVLMHIGIWLTMSIGIFSAVAICGWLLFVPTDVWNSMTGEPFSVDEPASDDASPRRQPIVTCVCTVFLCYMILQNVSNAVSPAPNPLHLFGRATMTIQEFRMFAEPPVYSPWFEYVGQLEGGRVVELFSEKEKRQGQKPESIFRHMKSQRWRRLHWNLSTNPDNPPDNLDSLNSIRRQVLNLVVDRWNRNHAGEHVKSAELICHLEPIDLGRGVQRPSYEYRWARYDVNEIAAEERLSR